MPTNTFNFQMWPLKRDLAIIIILTTDSDSRVSPIFTRLWPEEYFYSIKIVPFSPIMLQDTKKTYQIRALEHTLDMYDIHFLSFFSWGIQTVVLVSTGAMDMVIPGLAHFSPLTKLLKMLT